MNAVTNYPLQSHSDHSFRIQLKDPSQNSAEVESVFRSDLIQTNEDQKDPLLYFSSKQQEKFSKLDLDHFISKKYIAHLFGDSFLEGSLHEGWFIGDALIHMIHVLKENQISPEITKVMGDLTNCFNWQGRYMSVLFSAEENALSISAIEKIKEDLCTSIRDLGVGDNLVFPGGYKGHSVLYEVKRLEENRYEFIVYNTGDGSHKHWMIVEKEGVHKIKGAYKIENISLEDLVENDFIETLLIMKINESENFGEELYEDILFILKGEREKVPTDIREYMTSQRSGTCAWKMLCAFLRYNLPMKHYKYLKLKARLDVFEKWADLGYTLDFHKTNQRLLNRLIVNYERIIYKRDMIPVEFSRKELLVLGLLKVQKTFNRYKFLLSPQEIKKAERCYSHFTGQSIYEDNSSVIRKNFA